jgi:hypothetical protein
MTHGVTHVHWLRVPEALEGASWDQLYHSSSQYETVCSPAVLETGPVHAPVPCHAMPVCAWHIVCLPAAAAAATNSSPSASRSLSPSGVYTSFCCR